MFVLFPSTFVFVSLSLSLYLPKYFNFFHSVQQQERSNWRSPEFQCKSRTIRMVRDQCTALNTFFHIPIRILHSNFIFFVFIGYFLPKRHDFSLFFFFFFFLVMSVVFMILLYENCGQSSLWWSSLSWSSSATLNWRCFFFFFFLANQRND